MNRKSLHCGRPRDVVRALNLLSAACALFLASLPISSAAQDSVGVTAKGPAPSSSTPLRVQGRVLGDGGQPLRGATVRLLPQSVAQDEAEQRWRGVRPRVAASMNSGENGRFELIAPDAGFWKLEVSLPGYATQRYELTPLVDDAVLPDVTLSLTPGFVLQVLDSAGKPIMARFSVQLPSGVGVLQRAFRSRGGAQWSLDSWQGRTNAQGEAKLPLPDEDWQVDVIAAGHEPTQVSLKEITKVRLQPAGGRVVEAVLADGQAAAGAYVYLDEGSLPLAKTDAEGRAQLSLSMEEYSLAWWHPAGHQASSMLPAVDVQSAAEGKIEEEVHRVELDSLLPVSGRVLESKDRTGLDGAWVWAKTNLGLLASRTEGEGRYAFALPVGDNTRIRAAASGYGTTSGSYSPPPPEEVAKGVQLTLLLEPTADLQGMVVNAEGQPIEGVAARLVAGASRGMFSNQFVEAYRLQGLSDTGGRLDFKGLAAERGYTLKLEKEGFAPAEFPVDALQAQEVRRDLRWTLAQGARGVGHIVDSEDQPVAGAEVLLSSTSTGNRRAAWFRAIRGDASPTEQTDREGRFVLRDLAPGRYDLEAKAPGFSRGVVRGLEVPEGVGEIDFGVLVLAPGVELAGRVVDADGVALAGVDILTHKTGNQGSRMFEMMAMARGGQEPAAVSGEDGRFVVEDGTAGDQLNVVGRKEGFISGVARGVKLPSDQPVEIVLQRASGISGLVLDADGAPLDGVTVMAIPDDVLAARQARINMENLVTTDLEGRFALDAVQPGLNKLRAQKSGFQTLQVSGFEVPVGQPLEGVELRLQRGADLVGSLKDADGEPVAGGMILLMDSNSNMVDGGYAQTDGDGAFQLSGLPLGKYVVSGNSGGAQKASRHITIEEGENTVELTLESTVSVAGQVTDASGAPVQGARVNLNSAERMSRVMGGYLRVESSADGSFRFDDVAAGAYQLSAKKEGLGRRQLDELLTVADTPIEGLQLRLGDGARVVGRILGLSYDEMNRVQVTARGMGSNEVTQPNFEGIYGVDHVLPGDLWITARLQGSSRTAQEKIVVEEGAAEMTVDLEFVDGYVLTGAVYKMDQPADGLTLHLTQVGVVSVTATTDGEGRFRFEGLQEGTYTMRLSGWETSLQYQREIELTSDEDIRIDLEVARLAGQVVDSEGQPIANARLVLEGGGTRALSELSDSLGQFDFGETSPGVWELSARRSGYAVDPMTVELETGQVKDDVRLEMQAVRGIVLQVVRHDGRPMSSVRAGFLGPSGFQSGAVIQGDDTGRFIVDTLADGTWQMVLGASGFATAVQSVTAPSQDPVRVVLQPDGQLQITVPALRERGLGGILEIVSSTGQPFYNVRWDGQVEQTYSLRQGGRRLEGLTPGTWRVHVTGDDGSVWQGSVNVQAGQEATLELQ